MIKPHRWTRTLLLGLTAVVWLTAAGQAENSGLLCSAQPVTVEQLERVIDGLRGQRDGKVVQSLNCLELTERASSVRLERWQKELRGTKSQQELTALAAASAFLAPPAAEIPAAAPPDAAEQRRILLLTIDYLHQTLPRLPNFSATRTTSYFSEALPTARKPGSDESTHGPLRKIDQESATVLFRDGKELVQTKGRTPATQAAHLNVEGVFGSALTMVLDDAVGGSLNWSRWEQGTAGLVAVFHFVVPESKSHYVVGYKNPLLWYEGGIAQRLTGYHGELAIDPATGAVLRQTVQADLTAGLPIVRSDTLVEYGPVVIAGKSYICPVRNISIERGGELPRLPGGADGF